jgi:DNA-3-methyladenine glycosylase II
MRRIVARLADRDPALAAVVARHGMPPLWPRDPGFETLVRIVLEQQVTLRSGAAAFERLVLAAGGSGPEAIAGLEERGIRGAGITRQKARYVAGIARDVVAGELDLAGLATLPDDAVRARLLAVNGVGSWTAEVYLLMALRRPDAWPAGDIALATSAHQVLRLDARPTPAGLTAIAERWRPWRAVAARLLWHAYLSTRAAGPAGQGDGRWP